MTASPASGAGCCGRAAADTGDAGAEAASGEASTTTGFRWMAKFRDPAVPEDAGVLSGGAAFRCRHSRSEKNPCLVCQRPEANFVFTTIESHRTSDSSGGTSGRAIAFCLRRPGSDPVFL